MTDPVFGNGGFPVVAEGCRLAIRPILLADLLDVPGVVSVDVDFVLANLFKEVSFVALPPLICFGRHAQTTYDALSSGALAALFSVTWCG